MADYYPLLARALGALPDRTPALRKAVYDRARSALIAQLRSLDPPVPEAAIELERKALDTAIERLETEYGAPPAAAEPEAATPSPAPVVSLAKPEAEAPAPPPPPPPPAPEPFMPPASLPDDMLPEPGPPVDAEPFVPPPRRPRADEAREAPEAEARPEEPGAPPPAPPAEGEEAALGEAANGRQRPRIDVVAPPAERSRFLRNLFVGGVLVTVIGLIAVAAFFLRDQPGDLQRSAATSQENPPEAPDAKFADRVGGERGEAEARPKPAAPPTASAQPEVTVSQRAVLYEENAADPRSPPASMTGHAVWRLEAVNGQQGEPLQNALRTTIEYPEAGLSLTMTLRRNRDTTLPASHTIELAFTNYGPGAKRAVQNIGLLQPKEEETARGAPISGLPVRVRENLFLIGLSSLKSDVDRNTDLLLHRNWFDLPISYASGTRAILTFEKGNAGAQAMQAAFDQWRD